MKFYRNVVLMVVLAGVIAGCSSNTEEGMHAADGNEFLITINTNFGTMKAILYDETPKHKQNFLKLIDEGFYDSLLFHRIIEGFMIQGGDPNSRNAGPEVPLGSGGPGYTIPAEFDYSRFHEKGALSAARQGDAVNPAKESSGSQFYIVQGQSYPKEVLSEQLLAMCANQIVGLEPEHEISKAFVNAYQSGGNDSFRTEVIAKREALEEYMYVDERAEAYATTGGAPHLDYEYTVFGKVISGLDVLDMISAVATTGQDQGDRPLEDVWMTVTLEELPKTQITRDYGYEFE